MRLCSMLVAFLGVGVAAWPVPARADAPLYAYVDAEGTLHITDRLGDVPEPYQAIYRKQELLRSRRGDAHAPSEQSPASPGGAPPPPELSRAPQAGAEAQADARRRWQQTMALWRQRLSTSTEALRQAEQENVTVGNPLMRETPVGKKAWQALLERMAKARSEALQARRMLIETLPEQARAQHVPPQWLLP